MITWNRLRFLSVGFLCLISLAAQANEVQWQYNQHTAIGSTTLKSAPAYASGEAALTTLGNTHYNRVSDNGYYIYQFINLENINCPDGATTCSASARYKRCVLSNGITPENDGQWRHNGYGVIKSTPRSEYMFADGYSALSSLAAQHYNGLENTGTYFYLRELVNFSCNANETSCSASPEYEWCGKDSGMTPENRGKWKHGSYGAFSPSVTKFISPSGYEFNDPMAAVTDLGHKYYDGLRHGGYSYRFIAAVDLSCTNYPNSVNSCRASPRYEQCNDDTGECESLPVKAPNHP